MYTSHPAIPPETGRRDKDREPPPCRTSPLAQRYLRSQPRHYPPALAGPASTPMSSQGIISGHAEKPWEAKPHHTEGRTGRKEGPPCSGNRAVTTSPGVPPALSLGWATAATTNPSQAPSCPAGGSPRAGTSECTNAGIWLPRLPSQPGVRAGDFSFQGSIRPNNQDWI